MSAHNFFLFRGETPMTKSVVLSGAGTHSIWIPQAGRKVVVTGVSITSLDVAGTIAFYFDNGNSRIAQYNIAASGSVMPVITGWHSTVQSGRIFATKSAIQTDGINISLTGFEIE